MDKIANELVKIAKEIESRDIVSNTKDMDGLKDTIVNFNSMSKTAKEVFNECDNFWWSVGKDLQLLNGRQIVASCNVKIVEEGESKVFHSVAKIKLVDMWVRVKGTKVSMNIF